MKTTAVRAEWLVQNGEAQQRFGLNLYLTEFDAGYWHEFFERAAHKGASDIRAAMDQGKLWEKSYLITDPRDEDDV